MARWTEFRDFRDDCKSIQASGASYSTACEEALHRELEPPPYLPASHFRQPAKQDLYTGMAKAWIWQAKSEIMRLTRSWLEGVRRSGSIGFLLDLHSLEVPHVVTRVLKSCNWLAVLIFIFLTVRKSQNYCLQNANPDKR